MVVVYIAQGFEEIEAITVYDILKRADIEVVLANISEKTVVLGAHGLYIMTEIAISSLDVESIDMAVLPGGMPGTDHLKRSYKLAITLEKLYNKGKRIAAICAAPMILGGLGYLKGKEAICYPGFEKYLKGAIISDKTTVTDGNITTSKGAGTAMEFALELVRLLKGEETSAEIAKKLQYDTEGKR